MNSKKLTIVLSLSLTLLFIPFYSSIAYAEYDILETGYDTHYTSKVIIQWGLDGGFTFSVSGSVSSTLQYDVRNSGLQVIYDYKLSDASIYVSKSYQHGMSSCGSTLIIRQQTIFGSETVSLPVRGEYIVSPGDYITGYKSSGWLSTKYSPFSVSVENYGSIQPTPSLCLGGGGISDSFTINH